MLIENPDDRIDLKNALLHPYVTKPPKGKPKPRVKESLFLLKSRYSLKGRLEETAREISLNYTKTSKNRSRCSAHNKHPILNSMNISSKRNSKPEIGVSELFADNSLLPQIEPKNRFTLKINHSCDKSKKSSITQIMKKSLLCDKNAERTVSFFSSNAPSIFFTKK